MNPAMASIVMFAADFAPKNWALCQGQILAIAQNQALFSLLGTTYGGNGITTFALPDLRGHTPIGVGNGAGISSINLGEVSGINQITLTNSNLPQHNHTGTINVGANSQNANTEEPDGANPAVGQTVYAPNSGSLGALGGLTVTVANNGSSTPTDIRQPYIGIHFIICLFGIYPSRP